jgi:hypothetical protein
MAEIATGNFSGAVFAGCLAFKALAVALGVLQAADQ